MILLTLVLRSNALYALDAAAALKCLAGSSTISVQQHGASGDGATDDAPAIQRALDAAQAGSVVLIPKGHYKISRSLVIRNERIALVGDGAVLEATTPNDQAIEITADHVVLAGLRLQGISYVRLNTPSSSKILLRGRHARIFSNTIIGGASVGIFLSDAHHVWVYDNTVENTLADGIHITKGSSNVIVERNTVGGTGDDMIAVVSYRKHANMPACSDVVIRENRLLGNHHGRGIAVVGGTRVTIEKNHVERVNSAAGIHIAQEDAYNTMNVSHVLVQDNTVVDNQQPPWVNKKPTHHAALNINTGKTGNVRQVLFKGNHVSGAYFSGMRFMDNSCQVAAVNNLFTAVEGAPLIVNQTDCLPEGNTCIGNKMADGTVVSHPGCLSTQDLFITGSYYTDYVSDEQEEGWSSCLAF
jgi:parallel beta-helix repeat protein